MHHEIKGNEIFQGILCVLDMIDEINVFAWFCCIFRELG